MWSGVVAAVILPCALQSRHRGSARSLRLRCSTPALPLRRLAPVDVLAMVDGQEAARLDDAAGVDRDGGEDQDLHAASDCSRRATALTRIWLGLVCDRVQLRAAGPHAADMKKAG